MNAWIEETVAAINAASPRDLAVRVSKPEHGMVRIDYVLESGDEIRRVFTCNRDGGDISEMANDGEQVPAHAYLASTGALLTCETIEALPQALHTELLATVDADRITHA